MILGLPPLPQFWRSSPNWFSSAIFRRIHELSCSILWKVCHSCLSSTTSDTMYRCRLHTSVAFGFHTLQVATVGSALAAMSHASAHAQRIFISECLQTTISSHRDRAISRISDVNFSSNLEIISSNLETNSSIDGPRFSSMSPKRARKSDVGGLS